MHIMRAFVFVWLPVSLMYAGCDEPSTTTDLVCVRSERPVAPDAATVEGWSFAEATAASGDGWTGGLTADPERRPEGIDPAELSLVWDLSAVSGLTEASLDPDASTACGAETVVRGEVASSLSLGGGLAPCAASARVATDGTTVGWRLSCDVPAADDDRIAAVTSSLGVDGDDPRFFWELDGDAEGGVLDLAYTLGSTGHGDAAAAAYVAGRWTWGRGSPTAVSLE